METNNQNNNKINLLTKIKNMQPKLNPDKINGFTLIGVVIGVPLLLWTLAGFLPDKTQATDANPNLAIEEWKKEWDSVKYDIDNLKAQLKVKEITLCTVEKNGAKIKLAANSNYPDKYPLPTDEIARLAAKRDSLDCLGF